MSHVWEEYSFGFACACGAGRDEPEEAASPCTINPDEGGPAS